MTLLAICKLQRSSGSSPWYASYPTRIDLPLMILLFCAARFPRRVLPIHNWQHPPQDSDTPSASSPSARASAITKDLACVVCTHSAAAIWLGIQAPSGLYCRMGAGLGAYHEVVLRLNVCRLAEWALSWLQESSSRVTVIWTSLQSPAL